LDSPGICYWGKSRRKEINCEAGVFVQACNLSVGRLRQEDLKFEAGLDYVVRPSLNNNNSNNNYDL
jgi:hypothetical protein